MSEREHCQSKTCMIRKPHWHDYSGARLFTDVELQRDAWRELARELGEALKKVDAKIREPSDPDAEHWTQDAHKPYHWLQVALARLAEMEKQG